MRVKWSDSDLGDCVGEVVGYTQKDRGTCAIILRGDKLWTKPLAWLTVLRDVDPNSPSKRP